MIHEEAVCCVVLLLIKDNDNCYSCTLFQERSIVETVKDEGGGEGGVGREIVFCMTSRVN